jgi:phosphoribosylformylglycinamidine (FGAM) synthase PurS component
MAEVRITGFNGAHDVQGDTVLEALEAAGFSAEVTVRLQGSTVRDLQQALSDGDQLVVVPPEVKQGA